MFLPSDGEESGIVNISQAWGSGTEYLTSISVDGEQINSKEGDLNNNYVNSFNFPIKPITYIGFNIREVPVDTVFVSFNDNGYATFDAGDNPGEFILKIDNNLHIVTLYLDDIEIPASVMRIYTDVSLVNIYFQP